MKKQELLREAVRKIGYTPANIKINGSVASVSTTENENFEILIFERKRQQADDPTFALSEDGVRMVQDCKCSFFANMYGNIACTISAIDMYHSECFTEFSERILVFTNPLKYDQANFSES